VSRVLLADGVILLGFDERGRIDRFRSELTDTEFITRTEQANNWQLTFPEGRYAIVTIEGKNQQPASVASDKTSATFRYESVFHQDREYPIAVDFTARLKNGEARFSLRVTNNHDRRVRELWYPIIGGFEGWTVDGEKHIVNFAKASLIAPDILRQGLPQVIYAFGVDGETARFNYPERYTEQMNFIDLYADGTGLYLSTDDSTMKLSTLQLHKYPVECGTGGERTYDERHIFPPDHPRWLTLSTGRVTTIDPGQTFTTPEAVFWPHAGDWHVASDHYRAQVSRWMVFPERTRWLDDYVGWHQLVGKTYLEEHYFTFAQATETMLEVTKRTGINVLMLYGHTEYGCESAPWEIGPGSSLGGVDGFRQMCDTLHTNGIKVMVFGHRQSALAVDEPCYERFRDWTIRDRDGVPRREVWYKTTLEASMAAMGASYEASGPIWHRVCPWNDEWWEGFRDELLSLASLGLDGYQLDLIGVEGTLCFAPNHGHIPGEGQLDKLIERLLWLRKEVHAQYPDFLFAGEELRDWQFQCLDHTYSRYRRNNDGYQVYRYTFPEFREHAAVGAYAYDQANKSIMFGWDMNIEVSGLKESLLIAPDFMDYLGGITAIRRAHGDYLIKGRYRDHDGATVSGELEYGTFAGPGRHAVVVRNIGDTAQTGTISIDGVGEALLCRPQLPDEIVQLPAAIEVGAHRVAVLIPHA
jgi:hypothetical protein